MVDDGPLQRVPTICFLRGKNQLPAATEPNNAQQRLRMDRAGTLSTAVRERHAARRKAEERRIEFGPLDRRLLGTWCLSVSHSSFIDGRWMTDDDEWTMDRVRASVHASAYVRACTAMAII